MFITFSEDAVYYINYINLSKLIFICIVNRIFPPWAGKLDQNYTNISSRKFNVQEEGSRYYRKRGIGIRTYFEDSIIKTVCTAGEAE